jgi:hypothetical protein
MHMLNRRLPVWQHINVQVSTLVLVLLALLAGVATSVAPVAHAAEVPEVEVRTEEDVIQAGETMELIIELENWTDLELSRVDVKIPYNTQILTPSGSRFEDDDDWVRDIDDGEIVVSFEDIDDDEGRWAVIELDVNPDTPDNTKIDYKADYYWYAENGQDDMDTTEDFEVLVRNPGIEPNATITPQAGPAGTVYQIQANRFQPNETVVTWLNTPSGVESLDLSGLVGNPGTIQLQFDSSGLAPGDYSIVLHGMQSEREYVLPFTVTAP